MNIKIALILLGVIIVLVFGFVTKPPGGLIPIGIIAVVSMTLTVPAALSMSRYEDGEMSESEGYLDWCAGFTILLSILYGLSYLGVFYSATPENLEHIRFATLTLGIVGALSVGCIFWHRQLE